VASGQRRSDIQFAIDAAPTIVGRIKDESNIPIANILVEALKEVFGPRGDRAVVTAVSALSDDRGEFHLYWLDPGNYYIRASSLPAKSIPDSSALKAAFTPEYAPYYYPGFRDPKDAAKFRIRAGSQVSAFDFKLATAPGAGLGGYVTF